MNAIAQNVDASRQSPKGGRPNAKSPTAREIAEQGARFVPQTLRYLGVPPEPLMDAAQDVFLVALRRLDDFEGRSSLTTWLYGICLRVAHEYRRRGRSSRETLVDVIPEVGAEASQEFAVTQTEWQRALAQLLNQLDESQRDVFVLFEIQRLSMKEVAEIVGCPLPTAYFWHKAARTRVLEAFQHQAAMEEL